MEMVLSYLRQYANALGNRSRQPLMETVCNRLWKRYATACLVTYPVMQPLMETVLALPKSLEPLHLFSRKASQYQYIIVIAQILCHLFLCLIFLSNPHPGTYALLRCTPPKTF